MTATATVVVIVVVVIVAAVVVAASVGLLAALLRVSTGRRQLAGSGADLPRPAGSGADLPRPAVPATRPEAGEQAVVHFVAADGARQPVAVDRGTSLAAAARQAGLGLPAGCDSGTCGVDPVTVLSGRHNVTAPAPEEQQALSRFDLPEGTRLACVTRVTGEVTVAVRPPAATASALEPDPQVTSVVIVGGGIAGLLAAQQVRRLHPTCDIRLLGWDPDRTYPRAALAELLPDQGRGPEPGRLPEDWFVPLRITAPPRQQAVAIDPDAHEVTVDTGERVRYGRLILATGGSCRQPAIDGLPVAGVHAVRSVEEALTARLEDGDHPDLRNVVVVGGGPVGVETAAALSGRRPAVTLVDREPWLLPGVADDRTGELVADELRDLGVAVHTGVRVERVYGESRVAAVGLSDGRQLSCDLLLLCPRVRPTTDLPRAAGLVVKTGVVVDDTMRTSHPDVFAVGEVAELPSDEAGSGQTGTEGSAALPAIAEQAAVAAEQAVARDPAAAHRYQPGPPVTRLQLADLQVTAIGRTVPAATDSAVVVFDEPVRRQYRKILVAADGRVSGGIAVNDPDAVAGIESAVAAQTDLRPLLDARELITSVPAAPQTTGPAPRPRWRGVAFGAVAAAGLVVAATVSTLALTGTLTDTLTGNRRDTSTTQRAPAPSRTVDGSGTGGAGATAPAPPKAADPRVADVLQNSRISWSEQARQTLLAGGADARLLALLVTLAAEHEIAISALPQAPDGRTRSANRAVAISALDGEPLTGPRARELAGWFNAQQPPYRPAAVLVSSAVSSEANPVLIVALDGSAAIRPATP